MTKRVNISCTSKFCFTVSFVTDKQNFRDSLTLDSCQPPVKWTVEAAQDGAILGAAILQAEGCDAVTNCIGGAETAISAVSTIRTSPGFYTLAAGGKSGPSELYAILSTNRYEYEDLSSTTDADLGGRSMRRGGSNNRFRRLQESVGIPVDYFVSGIEALKTNLLFKDLQISLTLTIDPGCSDDQKCTEDIDTGTGTNTSKEVSKYWIKECNYDISLMESICSHTFSTIV